jgi:hypothetical protein
MESFDQSGDGRLQPGEFVTVDKIRNKLDAIARDEKGAALELAKRAKVEEEALQFRTAQMDILNDREPTATERFVSVLPYLFPLLESLQYAQFLVTENADNPIAIGAAALYGLYRSIPLASLVAFYALRFLSGNPGINRLIRYNMRQAIYVDIALIFPGLIAGLVALVANGQIQIPTALIELGSDGIVLSTLAVCAYASVSSLLGATPDKIPFISDAVNDRMPSIEMFDQEGRFTGKKDDEDNK